MTDLPDGDSSSNEESSRNEVAEPGTVSRRNVLVGTGLGALAGLFIGGGAGTLVAKRSSAAEESTPTGPGSSVPAHGVHQAGVADPDNPQRFAVIAVGDMDLTDVPGALASLGAKILKLTSDPDPELLPDGAADVTVLVGLGPRALAATPAGAGLAGVAEMPLFDGDSDLPKETLGGDLLLSVNATDPGVLDAILTALTAVVPGYTPRWSEFGFRGPGEDGIARNPLGYHDGIIVPRGEEELDRDVWIADGPLAGGTICAIRRFRLHTVEFGALEVPEQNNVIGRDKLTGIPLSGGEMRDEANIALRAPNGDFVIPTDSHVHAAHPSFIGGDLMLRRSYSFSHGSEHGLIFTAFQKDVRTFVLTQQRMDDIDALMGFATPTASGCWAILPGFTASRPLGSTLLTG